MKHTNGKHRGGIKGIKRGLVSGWVVVGIIDESLVEQGGGTAPI